MNVTALALLGLAAGVGQPPADVAFTKARSSQLDINYTPEQRKNIAKVELLRSEDRGQTWGVADAVTAEKDHLVFSAKADGEYWLTMLITFRDGKKDPPDLSRLTTDRVQKLIVDATPPVVQITTARRDGEDVVVEWSIDEKYPDETKTQVLYKPGGAGAVGDWLPTPVNAVSKRTAQFKGPAGAVAVRIVVQDFAGNSAAAAQEIGGTTPVGFTTPAQLNEPGPGPTLPPPSLGTPPSLSGPAAPSGGGIIVPPSVPPPTLPSEPVTPQPASAQPPWTPAPAAVTPQPQHLPQPASLPVTTENPLRTVPVGAEGGGTTPPAADPATTQIVNFLRFDLQYNLDAGPSGVSRIDLYVTRDDGRTWTRWSQHDGRESPLRILLDTKFNQQPEGDYGFHLVPVSGAGLSDPPPTSGTAPEMRVHVDVTQPLIRVLEPIADPARRDALLLRWHATDRNFGREPVAIDWSEQPTGPWKPVTGSDSIVPVSGGQTVPAGYRVANTGSYSWQIPQGMTAHKVYFRYTAWDLAGNRTAVVTRDAFLVDLTKPRAKIQGIVTAGGMTPRQ